MINIIIGMEADLAVVGIQRVLATDERLRVVSMARMLDILLELVVNARPDVVLLSDYLNGANSIADATRLIKALDLAAVKVVVMGSSANGMFIREMFAAGVDGYLYANDDLRKLLPVAIHSVVSDRPYLSPTASREYLAVMHTAMQSGNNVEHSLDGEARAVLQGLACGDDANQIARRLGINKRRVYWVRDKLRMSFGARTNEHLIARAAAQGFITLQT